MRIVIVLFTLLYLFLIIDAEQEEETYTWEEHKERFELQHPAEEEDERRQNFERTDAFIHKYNAEGHKSVVGHNHFSSATKEEIERVAGIIKDDGDNDRFDDTVISERLDENNYPANLDWRNVNGTNYLSPIQNQYGCGSCGVFSATCTLESRWAIKNKVKVPNLSEQQIVDCIGWNVCNQGVWQHRVWSWLASTKDFYLGYFKNPAEHYNNHLKHDNLKYKTYMGQDYESNYPYNGKYTEGDCKYSGNIGAYPSAYRTTDKTIEAYHRIKRKSPAAFKAALQSGPIAVTLSINGAVLYHKSGLITKASCPTGTAHAANLIGYGENEFGKYWILRNTYGSWWGEGGYANLERTDVEGSEGACGILEYGQIPNIYGDCVHDGNCNFIN